MDSDGHQKIWQPLGKLKTFDNIITPWQGLQERKIYLYCSQERANKFGIFFNGPTPASISFIFGFFKQTMQFLQHINVKNGYPVYSTGIWTHDLSNVSRHP